VDKSDVMYTLIYFVKHLSVCSYYASTAFPPRLAPPLKRPRLMPPTRAQHPKLQKQQSTANTGTIPDLNQLKVYSKCRIRDSTYVFIIHDILCFLFFILKSNLDLENENWSI